MAPQIFAVWCSAFSTADHTPKHPTLRAAAALSLNSMQFINTNSKSPTKLKTQLKLACGRIRVAQGKKNALIQQRRRNIAELLLSGTEKNYEAARQKATALLPEERALGAYDIVGVYCDLLAERTSMLSSSQNMCPPDLVTPVSTMIWVATTTEMAGCVPELELIRQHLSSTCGKTFTEAAIRNHGGRVEERVYRKLSQGNPLDRSSQIEISAYMQDICRQHQVDWTAPPIPEPENYVEREAPFLLPAVTGHEGDAYESRDETENPLPFNLRLKWVNSLWQK